MADATDTSTTDTSTATQMVFSITAGDVELPLPAYGGYSWAIQDVDYDSGRTADGTMHRNRVARKRKLAITWPPMPKEEVSKILNAIKAESFTVEAYDFETGENAKMTMYVGDRTIPFLSTALSNGLCDSFTVDFVEF